MLPPHRGLLLQAGIFHRYIDFIMYLDIAYIEMHSKIYIFGKVNDQQFEMESGADLHRGLGGIKPATFPRSMDTP